MSTGGDLPGRRRDQGAEDEQTFADVLNGFSFGAGRRRRKASGTRGTPRETAHDESDGASPRPGPESYGPASQAGYQPSAWEAGDVEPGAPASFVRAYAWTGGRTRSHHHFEVETLVTAVAAADRGGVPGAGTQWDHAVLDMCREPRSVAEVAALLAVPLGVAKVLLGDMVDRGMLFVHEAATHPGDAPTQAVMERVLIGLRRL
ncbi:DUF742 domain-containing protein [Streptomyces sp. NPDC059740]|uniref:DUF742 domain-containing protein n=1 Tax=Streptomyces sp. NPDC059740 TaxID=3346926 RepID=UPI00365B35CF